MLINSFTKTLIKKTFKSFKNIIKIVNIKKKIY